MNRPVYSAPDQPLPELSPAGHTILERARAWDALWNGELAPVTPAEEERAVDVVVVDERRRGVWGMAIGLGLWAAGFAVLIVAVAS